MTYQTEYKTCAELENENAILRATLREVEALTDKMLAVRGLRNCDNCATKPACLSQVEQVKGADRITKAITSCSAFKPKESAE